MWNEIWDELFIKVDSHKKKSIVLRDFHIDNLFWLKDRTSKKQLVLIDFQDAVIGHPAYDLVSLLQDVRVNISDKEQKRLYNVYISSNNINRKKFEEAYFILGTQRLIKFIGIFNKLWLVENKARLNEDIGFNIQDPQKENRLENFIVDIVGEDEEGKVIIENQYNKSDHDHLGKLLTYLSNVAGTKKAIWIVEDARADHINTINWLNENIETCSFYLVKIEVFKIQNSPPAANFDLLAGPTEITKIKQKINIEDSNRGKARYKFWSLFLERSKAKTKMFNKIKLRV